MAQTIIGKVSIIPCGEFQPNTSYSRLSVVSYNGSSYIAISDNENVPVTDTSVWYLLAAKGDQGEQGIQGEKGDQGDTYEVTQEDLDAIAAQITSDASSAFNQNVTQKTNDFNNNAVAKTTAFDNNATTKTTDFDNNAGTKTTDFNNNATQQTENFDVHVSEQIEYFNDEVDGYVARLNILENDSALLESNFSKTIPSPSDNVTVSDSFNATVVNATLIGKTSQKSYTGKNLFTGNFSQFDNQGGEGSTYAYFKLPDDGEAYTLSLIAKNDFTPVGSQFIGLTGNGGNANGGYQWVISTDSGTTTKGTVKSKTSSTLRYISLYAANAQTLKTFTDNFDIILEKASEYTGYEPYVGGQPSPSPDYPQPIENVTGDIKTESSNKNLVITDLDEWNYTYAYATVPIKLKQGSTYRFSAEKIGELKVDYYNFGIVKDGNVYAEFVGRQMIIDLNGNTLEPKTLIIDSTWTNPKLIAYANENKLAELFNNYNIMLEESLTATSYVEHKGKSVTFPLVEGQKLMEGDYLAEDGIHHVRGQKNYTIEEINYFTDQYSNLNVVRFTKSIDEIKYGNTNRNISIICDKAIYSTRPTSYDDANLIGKIYDAGDLQYFIGLPKTITSLEQAQEYLGNITTEYTLKQEQIELYTSEQQTAWNNLQQLETYKNITYVFVSSENLNPDVNFVYLQDPTVEIDNRLKALEQAVVAQNSNN